MADAPRVKLQRVYRQGRQADVTDDAYWIHREILATYSQPILSPDFLERLSATLEQFREQYGLHFDVRLDVLIGGNFVISKFQRSISELHKGR